MTLFVTGGTGFVGSHVLRAALAAGHAVTALRRPGSAPRVPLGAAPCWHVGTLAAPLPALLGPDDVFVHLAAHSANVPYDTLEACHYWNVTCALARCEDAYAQGVRRFVVAGSCFEYGRAALRYDAIPADAPLEPVGTYPTSKAMASVALLGWALTKGDVSLDVLRLFHLYGEGEAAARFWPSLRRAATSGEDFPMTDGLQIRDFTPVAHAAAALLDACTAPFAPGARVRNVGTGRPQTLRAFAEHWWQHWQASGTLRFGAVPYRPGEVMRYVPALD